MLSYAVGGIAALILLIVILQFEALTSLAIWATVGTAVLAILASFRYCKAFWTWVLFRSGELGGDS